MRKASPSPDCLAPWFSACHSQKRQIETLILLTVAFTDGEGLANIQAGGPGITIKLSLGLIHVIRTRATKQQIEEMLQALGTYIKLAVDVRRGLLAGGGTLHADCESALLEDGSQHADV